VNKDSAQKLDYIYCSAGTKNSATKNSALRLCRILEPIQREHHSAIERLLFPNDHVPSDHLWQGAEFCLEDSILRRRSTDGLVQPPSTPHLRRQSSAPPELRSQFNTCHDYLTEKIQPVMVRDYLEVEELLDFKCVKERLDGGAVAKAIQKAAASNGSVALLVPLKKKTKTKKKKKEEEEAKD